MKLSAVFGIALAVFLAAGCRTSPSESDGYMGKSCAACCDPEKQATCTAACTGKEACCIANKRECCKAGGAATAACGCCAGHTASSKCVCCEKGCPCCAGGKKCDPKACEAKPGR